MAAKLLIVEDWPDLRASLQTYFEREGFTVAVAEDGEQALAVLDQEHPDLVIIDVVLPRRDGLEVCRMIRQQLGQSIGIIMMSEHKLEMLDRVVGLEVGADVYLPKPFETRELLAHARALLRRIEAQAATGAAAGWLVVDDHLRINFERREVEAGGRPVQLTASRQTDASPLIVAGKALSFPANSSASSRARRARRFDPMTPLRSAMSSSNHGVQTVMPLILEIIGNNCHSERVDLGSLVTP